MRLREIWLGDGWWDMKPFWTHLRKIGDERDRQKKHYRSTKNWSTYSTHFLGLVGEAAFFFETGIKIDKELRPEGDAGHDFQIDDKLYDIKTTQYYHDPHLKQYPQPNKWVDFYLLAGVDTDHYRVKVFGWTDVATLQNADLVNYGHGPQRSLAPSELNEGMPPWLPSMRKHVP